MDLITYFYIKFAYWPETPVRYVHPCQKAGSTPGCHLINVTVRRVVELAAFYPNREELRREYPELEDEDIRQALLYAAAHLDDRVLDLPLNHETAA